MTQGDRTTRSPSVASSGRKKAKPLTIPGGPRKEGARLAEAADLASGAGHARTDDNVVHVFISYGHADRVIAAALRESLIEIGRDRVDCFLDAECIQSGEDWRKRIETGLARADWLVCVFTGEQSQFCGYEVGVFSRGTALTKPGEDSRLVCLHDVDPPGLFAETQNRPIKFFPATVPSASALTAPAAWSAEEVQFYRESNVFRFLSDFCAYKDLYPIRNADDAERQTHILLSAAKRITLAFEMARACDVRSDTPTQLKLEVAFTSTPPGPVAAIPGNASVAGTFASFGLFGLMPAMSDRQLPSTSWEVLKAECTKQSTANALWMESLEREMVNAAQGRAPGTPEAVFSAASDGKLYRPILVRHVVHYDGTNQFDIIFVPTLPRQFLGLKKTSLLLAGLVQASRFRFAFLEQPERVAAGFDEARTDREFMVNCRQLRYDIERIELEAAELGVLDLQAFIAAFGAERRALAESFIEDWKQTKAELLAQLPEPSVSLTSEIRARARAAIAGFLAIMEGENRKFVLAALDAYREEVAG